MNLLQSTAAVPSASMGRTSASRRPNSTDSRKSVPAGPGKDAGPGRERALMLASRDRAVDHDDKTIRERTLRSIAPLGGDIKRAAYNKLRGYQCDSLSSCCRTTSLSMLVPFGKTII